MSLTSYYVRNKDEVKFAAAFLGMVASGAVLSSLLTRAIVDSPLRLSLRHLFAPLGMNAAAPGAFLLGMYLTGLVLLGLDQTKRPQSIVLGIVTLIGMAAMALNGQFFQYIGRGELSMIVLGIVAGILYIGLDNIKQITIVDPEDITGSTFERKGSAQLEFRSAERLLYLLLAFVVIVAFFEAYTDYAPFIESQLTLNLAAISTFQIVNPEGGQLAIDLAAIAVALLMTYVFLGYDAEKAYFIAGPKRSGKTHAAVALHQEAVNQGYNPRNESPALLELKSQLVESDTEWLRPTVEEKDLSFSFTNKGLLRKNIQLEALDYPGELLRAVIPVARYHNEPEEALIEEYAETENRDQWLQQRIEESRQKEYHSISDVSDSSDSVRPDGGVKDEDPSIQEGEETDDPFAETDTTESTFDEAEDEEFDTAEIGDSSATSGMGGDLEIVTEKIWPSFNHADTLFLIIDLERFLKDEPLEADALYNIYDKTDKEAIILATKADLIADEFAESHGWKTAWAREPYDEFRTYIQGELSEHNMIQQLLNKVERPYPVGYQTVEPEGSQTGEWERELDTRSNLGSKRVEVHGYEYVLERMN
jgi:hypothetical protein